VAISIDLVTPRRQSPTDTSAGDEVVHLAKLRPDCVYLQGDAFMSPVRRTCQDVLRRPGDLCVLGEEEQDGDDEDDDADDDPGDGEIERHASFDFGAVPVSGRGAARPN